MIAGGRCKIDTNTFENDMVSFQSRDDVLTVLVHLGYLAYNSITKEVTIPNEEVREAFVRAIKKSDWKYVNEAIAASDQLLQATLQGDREAVAQIKEKKYVQALGEYEGQLLLVGINYDKESKKHECVIEQLEKNG